jgi:uncharacterized protein (DUF952 family)
MLPRSNPELHAPPPAAMIYKLCPRALWREAERAGHFDGAPVDREDGFIHFSTAAQLQETADRHFRGEPDLLVVAVDAASLGADLRWEASRGGALFPHLYAPLPLAAVRSVRAVPVTPGADADKGCGIGHDLSRVVP